MRARWLPFVSLIACTSPSPSSDAGFDAPVIDAGVDAFRNDANLDANLPIAMPIFVADGDVAMAEAFAENLPAALEAGVRRSSDPASEVATTGDGTTRIAVVLDSSIAHESYQLETAAHGFVVRGGDVLGEQYGLAALLEAMGVRFFHPDESFVPATLATPDASIFGAVVTPEVAERGFMPWTLHPIESFFVLWEPSDAHLREAQRIVDWTVKNGTDFFTYPALDNIANSASDQAAWAAHTRAIVDYAHMRGLRVGLGVQLFGGASLQRALTLVPTGADPTTSIERRLATFSSIPFDSVQLTFGEFSGMDPQTFIDTLNMGYATIERVMPGVSVTATVHVGNFASTQVTYMGMTMPYYELVRFADPHVVPWIHTVFDFDLFEPTSDAYGLTDFSRQRGYLFDRLSAHQPVTYNPEDAYWITYDDSVPLYLPLYVGSRLYDLQQIRAQAPAGSAPLGSHVIFSSGWEWGYWQNDWAVMHMTRHLPIDARTLYHQMLDPVPNGTAVADIVADLIDIEHRAFIDQQLSGYTAGTDASFSVGLAMGVWSEPPHPSFADVQAMSATDRAAFRANVVGPLTTLRSDLMGIEARLAALSIDPNDPWLGEIVDGVHTTRLRVDDAAVLWGGAADLADGMTIEGALTRLTAIEGEETTLVAQRLAHFHAPNGAELTAETRRSVLLYQYGYLRHANDLCFYRRDRIQLANLAHGTSDVVPGCVL
jgi:hypothetical protein